MDKLHFNEHISKRFNEDLEDLNFALGISLEGCLKSQGTMRLDWFGNRNIDTLLLPAQYVLTKCPYIYYIYVYIFI